MKQTQSRIVEQTLRYLQQNQDKEITAAAVFHANNQDGLEFTTEMKALYESWLTEQVRKDNLKVTWSSGDVFSTKHFYLENYQKEYWNRKNWQV